MAASAAIFGGLRRGRASGEGSCRRFLFLHAEGGWDPLCVFVPAFDAGAIDMEPQAEPWSVGDFNLVDHPQRPLTRAFFEAHHQQVALINGVSTRSVNHETCQVVALTGSTSEDKPDWATILGYEERANNQLPHLVMSGPAFAGPHTVFVSHAQGLLQPTIDGTILTIGDQELRLPEAAPGRIVDRFLRQRSQALAQALPGHVHANDYDEALARARALVDSRHELSLASGADFRGRAFTAISALASGVSRCASVGTGFNWDTHADNTEQSGLFDGFFTDLEQILELLATTEGPEGNPLSDDTVIVVTSEMARTPAFNSTGGRDHWPYTSMLMMGPGINSGRSYGAYSDLYTGIGVGDDGELDDGLPGIAADSLGATLLQLGGIDPQAYLRGAQPVGGLLA